jgi:hypothetical protein
VPALLVTGVLAGLASSHRLSVPLNDVGATVASAALGAAVVVAVVADTLRTELPGPETVPFARLTILRLMHQGLLVLALGVVSLVSCLVPGAAAAYLFLHSQALLGVCSATARWGRDVPAWFPGVALVIGSLFFGVDRGRRVPRSWAWLLFDDRLGQVALIDLALFVAGLGLFVLVPPRGES